MLFWVRVTGLDVGSAIYLGCLKDASWGLPRAGRLELSTHFVGGHRRPGGGGKHRVTPALQKQARHFTPRNLCFLSGKIATGTSSSSPCGLTVRIKSNETHDTCTLRGETQCCAATSWKSALSGPRDACWG